MTVLNATSSSKKSSSGFSIATLCMVGGLVITALLVVGAIIYVPWYDLLDRKTDASFAKAATALQQKKWDDAVNLFDRSLKSSPRNPAALIGRSRAYLQLGRLDKALEDVNKALKIKPDSALALGQRGIILKLQGKYDKALEDFAKAIKLDKKYVWAYAQRADILSRKNDHEKAMKDLQKAIALNPNFVDGYRLRAWIFNRMGKCKQASEDFKRVEKMRPGDAWTLQDKAWFLLTCADEKLQDALSAMQLAKKANELSGGNNGLVLETLAEAHFQLGDCHKAAELQEKAIALQIRKCPDGSCVREMRDRLRKYQMAARTEKRSAYEILPLDSGY